MENNKKEQNVGKELSEAFGNLVLVILLIFGMSLINGLMFSKLWQWFIITAFSNMPILTVMQSVGLCLMVGFFSGASKKKSETPFKDMFQLLVLKSILMGFAFIIFKML